MSEHLYTFDDPPSTRDLERACGVLERGGVLIVPTGLNWAFCCDASNQKALEKIRRLKPTHPRERPFSLLCHDMSMASSIGNIDHQLYRYLKKAWPGPFTVIVKRNRSLPRQIKDKRHLVGIRIPECPMLLSLIAEFGKPLATSTLPLETGTQELLMGYQIFDKYGHAIDLLLDLGGQLPGLESTVIDFSEGYPILIRKGEGDETLFGDLVENP